MNRVIDWFKLHWQQQIFKNSIIFILINVFFHFFFPQDYHDFMVFIFLIVGKDLITNIIKNDAFVTALGIGLAGIIVGVLKKWNKKNDD